MKTVLLVEDSPTIRNVVKVHLMGLGLNFEEASEGRRALQVLRLMPVDLVIADVNMEGMDGLTFVKEVRADPRATVRDVPVLLLTSQTAESMAGKIAELQVQGLLNKPVNSAKLVENVKALLGEA